jgi:FG-GAP-like repeat
LFTFVTAGTAPPTAGQISALDFNHDGYSDLIWQNDATRQATVWYLGGPQGNTLAAAGWISSNPVQGWRIVAIADFNGDGRADLVWQSDATRQATVWYLGGLQGGTLLGSAWLSLNGVPGWHIAAAADLNGDQHPDLIWQSDTTGQATIWYLGGTAGTTLLSAAWLATNNAPGWNIVGLADFNGDGHRDVVWQNAATGRATVWFLGGSQGSTLLGATWLTLVDATGWSIVGTADLNHDAHPDLIWQNNSTRQVSVWYLGGAQGNVFVAASWISSTGTAGWKAIAR